ncbi:Hypothetical predicted protein, partial [Paramuricea clavata]
MSKIVDKKLLELTGKIKALNFAIKKSDEVIDSTKTEVLTRQISSITNQIQAIYALKEEIEEIKFTDNDSEENIQNWAEEIESRISEADNKKDIKEIKVDLVRGNEGWQDWDLTRLIVELKKWRDINPVDESGNTKKQRKSGFYYAKDGDRRKRACVYCDAETHNSKDCLT